jgi:tetratricopeptide (TPR) repeat protein
VTQPPDPPARRVLEADQPLSRSLLWRLQRQFFDRQGVRAWGERIVPFYITSNPWIADAYAQVLLGWLRDGTAPARAGVESPPLLDPRAPVYIVELGSGSGRFGHLFLERLHDLVARAPLPPLRLCYVFTDAAPGNLDFLSRHPLLAPRVSAGEVDFAVFDATADEALTLCGSGERLAEGSLRNPLVVVANYLFDSLPQDAFTFRDGRAHECAVTLEVPETAAGGGEPGPELLADLELRWRERPIEGAYYGEPDLDDLLAEYAAALDDTTVLFPCAALHCLRRLAGWSERGLLLLSGDKGYTRLDELEDLAEPDLARHGSVSMMVNYHALGRWLARRGGALLTTSHREPWLRVVAGLLGLPAAAAAEIRAAFDAAIERRGPDDYFVLQQGIAQLYEHLGIEPLLAWLRLSGWDPSVFLGAFPRLVSLAAGAGEDQRGEIHRAVHEVARAYFPLPEAADLAFPLGVVLCEIGAYDEALAFLRGSLEQHGANAATLHNLALCLFHLGDHEAARTYVERALEAAPDFAPAAELRARLGPRQSVGS